ncbi:MAG: PqqD family protein [Acidobacteriaceae bacterium]
MSHVYVARCREVAARVVGGELMILSAHDSKLFSLNEAATMIWEGADGVTPLSEIVEQRICAGFEVDRAVAFRDAEEVVEGLAQHGILKVSNRPIEEIA